MLPALHPRLPLAADETHLSRAARLAAAHTGGRVLGLLRDMDIDRDAFPSPIGLSAEEESMAQPEKSNNSCLAPHRARGSTGGGSGGPISPEDGRRRGCPSVGTSSGVRARPRMRPASRKVARAPWPGSILRPQAAVRPTRSIAPSASIVWGGMADP